VLVGGGSAGHITPLLAVAHELKRRRPSVHLIYIGEKGSKFEHVVQKDGVFDDSYLVSAGKLRRYPGSKLKKAMDVPTNARNLRDGVRLARGTVEARKILKHLKPDGIFFAGGFVGVPVGTAGHRLKIPLVTHDLDAAPGLANRIIGRWAAVHATGMPAEFYHYTTGRTVFVGVPIGREYEPLTPASRTRFRNELNLDHFTDIITITGGSQGAVRLNKSIETVLPELLADNPRLGVLLVAGAANEAATSQAYDRLLSPERRAQVIVKGFVDDLWRYTGAAEVVITRAGASTVAQLAAQRQACIIVPSGELANDHQTKNAAHIKEQGAAIVLTEKELDAGPQRLAAAITDLLHDGGQRATLGRNLARLNKPDAAGTLAELLLNTFKEGGR